MSEEDNNTSVDSEQNEGASLPTEGVAAEAEVMLENERHKNQKENKKTRNIAVIALLLVLLLAAGGFLLFGSTSDTEDSNANQESSNQQSEEQTESSEQNAATMFDQIVYAHSSSENSTRNLFSRPAKGGDRNNLEFDFGINSFLTFDRDGNSYVVGARNGKIFYAQGENTPVEIFEASDNFALALDESSGSVLVMEQDLTNFDAVVTTITNVSVDGSSSSIFFTEDDASASNVLFLEHWDGENETLYARRSCTQCDGYNAELVMIDSAGTESSVFNPSSLTGPESSFLPGYTFNNDGTKALFFTNTVYDESNPFGIAGGLAGPEGAPFTLHVLDVASGTSSEVVTFGEGDDVGTNGFFDNPRAAWTDSTDGQQVAYSYLQKLFVQNSNSSFDNYFETSQGSIQSIYKVDDDEVLVGAKNNEGETISYFNIDTQEGAIVMETLITTTILGVTLK